MNTLAKTKRMGMDGISKTINKTSPIAFIFLCIYTALAYLRLHEYSLSTVDLPILPVILALTTTCWLIVERKDFQAPQFLLIVALLFLMSFSHFGATLYLSGTVQVFANFATIALLFVLVATTVNTPKRMGIFLSVLAWCFFVIAIHCIDQAQSGVGWTGALLSQGTRITYIGFLNDPNDLALSFLAVVPVVGGWVFLKRRPVAKLLGVTFLCVFLYGVYLSNSRGAVLALGFILFLMSFMRFRSLKTLLILPIFAVLLNLAAPSRVAEIDAKEESASDRIEAWYSGYQMIKRSPVFGVGQNNFQDHHQLTAHNSFVQAMAELGLFGHFAWISLLSVSVIMLTRAIRADRKLTISAKAATNIQGFKEGVRYTYILAYSLAGTLAASMFLSRAYVLTLYILIALIMANFSMLRQNYPALEMPSFRKLWPRLIFIQLSLIVGMWVLVKILLIGAKV
jgi:putative inorganic carbon (hco3(-)) transporter